MYLNEREREVWEKEVREEGRKGERERKKGGRKER